LSAHYSHALGKRVSSFTEEERELSKTGSWIASKDEANRLYDGNFTDDITIKRQAKSDYAKAADQVMKQLQATGAVNPDGSDKYTDPAKIEQISRETAKTISVPSPTIKHQE